MLLMHMNVLFKKNQKSITISSRRYWKNVVAVTFVFEEIELNESKNKVSLT
jgi:nitrate reductase NapAB chaperone NapD